MPNQQIKLPTLKQKTIKEYNYYMMKVEHHLLCCMFQADILSFLYNTLPCNTASE